MISIEYNFLFLHIPKTAGNSLQTVLKDYSDDEIVIIKPGQDGLNRFGLKSAYGNLKKHSKLKDYKKELDRRLFDNLFKFTIVRNPWERVVSFFHSPHRIKKPKTREDFHKFIYTVDTVKDFVELGSIDGIGTRCFKNIDYFIRFENLESDFEDVCDHIGIPRIKLPHYNKSEHGHYSEYYDDELAELVRDHCKEEIEFFGYKF